MTPATHSDRDEMRAVSIDEEGGNGLAIEDWPCGILQINEFGELAHIGSVGVQDQDELDALIEALEEFRDQHDE
jgi:hypothetical protein